MLKHSLLGLALAGFAATAAPQPANAAIAAGMLRCTLSAGSGYVIGSQRRVVCNYYNFYGELETYDGYFGTAGLDVGFTSISALRWAVIAPAGSPRGALEGNYGGVGLQATVAIGVGANGMLGGFQNSINLQPLNVSGQEGLNAQLGVTGLTLRLRTVRRR